MVTIARMTGFETVCVAAVQATPVILDADATIDKAIDLLGEAAERDRHLLLVGLRLGLDGHLDDRLGEHDLLELDRSVGCGERVAGDDLLDADARGDVAGVDLVDFFALVGTVSTMTHTPVDALSIALGLYLFPRLVALHPAFVRPGMTAKEFLKTVHGTIHVEVRKLHPDATLPSFAYEDPAPDRLVMIYVSSRKVCDLASGLLQGVAEHFQETIAQEQVLCTKRGDPHCRFELTFGKMQ